MATADSSEWRLNYFQFMPITRGRHQRASAVEEAGGGSTLRTPWTGIRFGGWQSDRPTSIPPPAQNAHSEREVSFCSNPQPTSFVTKWEYMLESNG